MLISIRNKKVPPASVNMSQAYFHCKNKNKNIPPASKMKILKALFISTTFK